MKVSHSFVHPPNNQTLLAFLRMLLKSFLNFDFSISLINSNNMFILIIEINNISKFNMFRLNLWLFYIFLGEDYEIYT